MFVLKKKKKTETEGNGQEKGGSDCSGPTQTLMTVPAGEGPGSGDSHKICWDRRLMAPGWL